MPWATRGDRKVFYESVWAGGKVLKVYYGTGPAAAAVAAQVAARKAGRARVKALRAAELATWQAVEAILDELDVIVKALMHARLTSLGFKKHKRGEWRRIRGSPDP